MELCGGVLGLGLPLEVYSYQQKVNLKIVPVNQRWTGRSYTYKKRQSHF
jgi:hypothetical protein